MQETKAGSADSAGSAGSSNSEYRDKRRDHPQASSRLLASTVLLSRVVPRRPEPAEAAEPAEFADKCCRDEMRARRWMKAVPENISVRMGNHDPGARIESRFGAVRESEPERIVYRLVEDCVDIDQVYPHSEQPCNQRYFGLQCYVYGRDKLLCRLNGRSPEGDDVRGQRDVRNVNQYKLPGARFPKQSDSGHNIRYREVWSDLISEIVRADPDYVKIVSRSMSIRAVRNAPISVARFVEGEPPTAKLVPPSLRKAVTGGK